MVAVLEVEVELEEIVCCNDGCSRRFYIGWVDVCEDCSLIGQDHEAGLHVEPVLECHDCW